MKKETDEDFPFENQYVKFDLKDGIVLQIFKNDIEKITLPMARIIVQDRQELTKGASKPLFVDFGNARAIEKEARDYFVTEESIRDVKIAAFYIDNYVAWAGAKLFLTFNKPTVKTELFRSKRNALEWLQANKR